MSYNWPCMPNSCVINVKEVYYVILKFSREYPFTYLQTNFNIHRWFFPLSNRSHKRENEQWEWKAALANGAGFLEVLFWEALLPFPKRRKEGRRTSSPRMLLEHTQGIVVVQKPRRLQDKDSDCLY